MISLIATCMQHAGLLSSAPFVYEDKFRFYTSSSRTFPAQAGACDPDDVKELTPSEREVVKYCRLFNVRAFNTPSLYL